MEGQKKEINPVIVIAVIAAAVLALALGAWRTAVQKPAYPGAMAGKPGQGPMTGPPAGMRIPGAPPGTTAGPGGAARANAGGANTGAPTSP